MLGRDISATKWRALLSIVLGCILVASPTIYSKDCHTKYNDNEVTNKISVDGLQMLLGVGSVLGMVLLSGYSSIYFEAMLKKVGENITIWERNFQLSFFSIILLSIMLIIEMQYNNSVTTNSNSISISRMFSGWTLNTVMITLIQALGGLLVAASLKYADAVLKTLATSGSIVLSTLLGWLLLNGHLDMFVIIGCISTIIAICNYTLD